MVLELELEHGHRVRWDGMGWDGVGWDGMGWGGMGWDGWVGLVGWDGLDWVRMDLIWFGSEGL